MPSIQDLVVAAGRAGVGSAGVSAAVAGASAAALRVRQWSAALAAQVVEQGEEVQRISAQAWAAGQVPWESQAGQAFGRLLESEKDAGARLSAELGQAAVQVKLAGEMVAAELEVLASAMGAAGAAFDAVLAGMSGLDFEMDDFVLYAEKAGLFEAGARLSAALDEPLVTRVSAALAEVGW